MAKLSAAKTAGYLKRPDAAHCAYLLYGPDPTLVTDRREALMRLILGADDDPFRLAKISGADLKKDPARLTDEINAIGFGGGDRVIVLGQAVDALSTAVTEALDARIGDAKLIVSADTLSTGSKLRKLFEGRKDAIALPCYPPEGAALSDAFEQALSDLAAPPLNGEARRALGSTLHGLGHGEAQRFAETLALYAAGEPEISPEAILATAPVSGETDYDAAIQAIALGRARALPAQLSGLEAQGASLPGLIRVLALYFQRLHRCRSLMEGGLDAANAMGKLRPPVFFKMRDAFAAQLRVWPLTALEAAMAQIGALEGEMRSGKPLPERALIERVLMRVAMSAPGARSRRH